MTNLQQLSTTLNSVDIKSKFEELLKGRSQQYITSILSAVSNNKLLETASWQSIYQASITAATLDLPINQNLGFAYLVPYKFKQKTTDDQGRDKWTDVCSAQFQLGYKGFIQLAQRSGQFLTINVTEVKEGEIKNYDRLTGFIDFDWKKEGRESLESIGYVGYFELINGFKKLFYMSKDELGDHGEKYSQSYNSSKMNYKTKKEEYTGLWRTNFDSMAKKITKKQS